jgi:hypothetical protein
MPNRLRMMDADILCADEAARVFAGVPSRLSAGAWIARVSPAEATGKRLA